MRGEADVALSSKLPENSIHRILMYTPYTHLMSSLDRSRILDCAIALGDDQGLAAITVRGVAQRLGVTSMALYRHVGGKDGLLDELADELYARLDLSPPSPDDWWETLRRLARSVRTILLAHPWALPLFWRPTAGPHEERAAE